MVNVLNQVALKDTEVKFYSPHNGTYKILLEYVI